MEKPKITCPYCGAVESKVTDSRPSLRTDGVFRRRECPNGHRYTTTEVIIGKYPAAPFSTSTHHNI